MPSIAARFTQLVSMLRTAIGVFVAREARPLHVAWLGHQAYVERRAPARLPSLPAPVWSLLHQRLHRLAQRFQALYDRWQSNTLPKPRKPRPTRARTHPAKPAPRLPRALGWVNHRIPESAPPSGWLESLLHDPDTREFVQAAPQAGRLLRPLCVALGLPQPGWLKLPPRPRKPRPRRAPPRPKLTRQGLLPSDRPLQPYVAAAARASKKRYAP